MGWMAHRKWKEIKQQPGTAGPGNMLGCCLLSFHFLWVIHPICPVIYARKSCASVTSRVIHLGVKCPSFLRALGNGLVLRSFKAR